MLVSAAAEPPQPVLPPLLSPALPNARLYSIHVAEDEALAALRILSAALGKARLRHLNLSDNALGEKGIRACAAAFSEQVGARCSGVCWLGMLAPRQLFQSGRKLQARVLLHLSVASWLRTPSMRCCRRCKHSFAARSYELLLHPFCSPSCAARAGIDCLPERGLLRARLRRGRRADAQHGQPAPPAPVQQHERGRGRGLYCTVSL